MSILSLFMLSLLGLMVFVVVKAIRSERFRKSWPIFAAAGFGLFLVGLILMMMFSRQVEVSDYAESRVGLVSNSHGARGEAVRVVPYGDYENNRRAALSAAVSGTKKLLDNRESSRNSYSLLILVEADSFSATDLRYELARLPVIRDVLIDEGGGVPEGYLFFVYNELDSEQPDRGTIRIRDWLLPNHPEAQVSFEKYVAHRNMNPIPHVQADVQQGLRASVREDLGVTAEVEDRSWQPSYLFDFSADIYPSTASASVAAVRLLLRAREDAALLQGEAPVGTQPADDAPQVDRPYKIFIAADDNYPASLTQVAVLLERLPEIEWVRIANKDTDEVPGTLFMPMFVVEKADGGIGTLRVHDWNALKHPDIQLRYVNKSWAEADPIDGKLAAEKGALVAHSQGLYATAEIAREQAIEHMVDQVERQYLLYKGRAGTGLNERWQTIWRDQVRNYLVTGTLFFKHDGASDLHQGKPPITDYFMQAFNRPYGQVSRCAVRVESVASVMDTLDILRVKTGEAQARQTLKYGVREHRSHLAAAVGLIVLVLGLYLFLNFATRGYYAWSLRIGVVILLAVLLVMLI